MKQLFTGIFFVVILSAFTTLSNVNEVILALKSGNAAQLAKYFDNNVEISMPDKNNNYSKSQAELVIQDFFTLNAVKGFDVLHKGGNAGAEYCIGTLLTKNGQFRTTIYLKQKGNSQVIQEISFEKR
jgi:Domain of unknown function (DUF4783)